jgi:hypothetical protein
MARFMATIKGTRGDVSRLGTPKSGINAKINGWNTGVAIYARVNENGDDCFDVYATGGSNGYSNSKHIARITEFTNDPKIEIIKDHKGENDE